VALEIHDGPRLAQRTTLGLGGRTLAELRADRLADLDGLPDALARIGGRPLVLGGGSNVLAADGDLAVVLVRLGRGGEPEILPGAAPGKVRVGVFGGYSLARLVAWCGRRGLSGLAGMAGIPGTVGGAAAGNAGSYGRDMAGVLDGVTVWTPGGGIEHFGPQRFSTGYRRFALAGVEGFFMIVQVALAFETASPMAVRQEAGSALAQKKATQPITAATAGSLFKNPPGDSAGRLLDQAGFRGKRIGGMELSAMHANFLVNRGGGTSDEAFELIDAARSAVRTRFGHELELEVRVVS
jgi:UDP-N-acetylmuramate dehydrogenase